MRDVTWSHPSPAPPTAPATAAYNQAVAKWQQAYHADQTALAALNQYKAKYLDANGNVRVEYWDAVVKAALEKLQQDVDYAWYDLDRAERERNAAHSLAVQEAQKAFKERVAPPAPAPSPRPANPDRGCARC